MEERTVPCRFLLVCTADRPPGTKPACGALGLRAFLLLQEFLDRSDSATPVVALPTGCLGFCEHAPVVVDPRTGDPAAFTDVTDDDLRAIAVRATRVEGEPWREKV